MDRREELLEDKSMIKAVFICMNCKYLKECEAEDWEITLDIDGETCDKYLIEQSKNKGGYNSAR